MLLVSHDVGQQSEMAGTLDFASQLTLTARAVAGLATRFDFAAFVDVAEKDIDVFVVEAAAFGAVGCPPAASAPAPAPVAATATTSAPATTTTPAVLRRP